MMDLAQYFAQSSDMYHMTGKSSFFRSVTYQSFLNQNKCYKLQDPINLMSSSRTFAAALAAFWASCTARRSARVVGFSAFGAGCC